jgi:hypothetical protein
VAILVQEHRRNSLYFDRKFPRLKRVLGDVELGALEYYLEDLDRSLATATDPDAILNTYAPQIVPSDARKIALPLNEQGMKVLLRKLLRPSPRLTSRQGERGELDAVTRSMESYLKVDVGFTGNIQTGVSSKTVFGERIRGLGRIALGVHKGSTWLLLDGVDLNAMAPEAAVKRADEVARTFWRFDRQAAGLDSVRLKRIALVLNGKSNLRPATLDAHDYSLHRFQADADRVVDASSAGAAEVVRQEVLNVGG